MIKLSIPFTKDNLMLSLVKEEHLKYVEEIYMPVPHSIIESARSYDECEQNDYELNVESYVKQAKDLGLKVNFIANKQFISPEKLRSTSLRLCKFLKRMKELYDIDKVTLSNFYIIGQYGEYIKEMGIDIELSVLVNVDSYSALKEILTVHPCLSSVCLSDKMIHRADELAVIKDHFSSTELKLIPNHGCLIGCPFEKQHHNYLAYTFSKESDDMIKNALNTELRIANEACAGCWKYLSLKERHIREMSFIRPDDVDVYKGIIDKMKISGRVHPAETMIRVIEAYGKRSFDGNIEELLDLNVHHSVNIPNAGFPREFGEKRSNCKNECYKCNYCNTVYQFVKSHLNK